ncbi:MarR family transcriptional regulator [Arthrobacter sp. NPDC080073]|uniref:MarR family winged helix-turn-helix transcriptional regulator n=1 Tax=Arthrobacter sp. NPDC080073 TaxID=3155919 RepID=UPI003437493F
MLKSKGVESGSRESTGSPRITYLIKSLELAIRHDLDEAFQGIGLTAPQYAALSALRYHPGLSSARLARTSFVTAQSMHVMVAGFVKNDYIERRPDPQNLRILKNYLTDNGYRVLALCDAAADVIETKMLEGMSFAQRELLKENVAKCVQNLRALTEVPDTPEGEG